MDGECVECLVGCTKCSPYNITFCEECSVGYYEEEEGCRACAEGCEECTVDGCVRCMQGYLLDQDACVENCRFPCLHCVEGLPSHCSSCFEGYELVG